MARDCNRSEAHSLAGQETQLTAPLSSDMFSLLTTIHHLDEILPVDGSIGQPVKSADRVLEILEMLSKHPVGLSITELSAHLNFPRSSTHGLVQTLVKRGYLQSLPDRRGFRLSAKLIQLAMGVVA